jgi:hypothetical protein
MQTGVAARKSKGGFFPSLIFSENIVGFCGFSLQIGFLVALAMEGFRQAKGSVGAIICSKSDSGSSIGQQMFSLDSAGIKYNDLLNSL